MSAYVVDPAHIDVLVDAAYQFQGSPQNRLQWSYRHDLRDLTRSELGRMLLDENVRSVNYRYREAENPSVYLYRPTNRIFKASQVLMAIRGYEYQACEATEWQESEAFAFCEALRKSVIRMTILESDDDQWEWNDRLLGRGKDSA